MCYYGMKKELRILYNKLVFTVQEGGREEGGREGRRREREGETTNSISCGFSTGPANYRW